MAARGPTIVDGCLFVWQAIQRLDDCRSLFSCEHLCDVGVHDFLRNTWTVSVLGIL